MQLKPLTVSVFLACAMLAPSLPATLALAHHGWGWASGEQFEITGRITAVRLGNPHGEVTIEAEGAAWEVEVGQPWRNARAGLTEALLAVGTVITVSGHRADDPDVRVVKAERVTIDGKTYDLYPDRD